MKKFKENSERITKPKRRPFRKEKSTNKNDQKIKVDFIGNTARNVKENKNNNTKYPLANLQFNLKHKWRIRVV